MSCGSGSQSPKPRMASLRMRRISTTTSSVTRSSIDTSSTTMQPSVRIRCLVGNRILRTADQAMSLMPSSGFRARSAFRGRPMSECSVTPSIFSAAAPVDADTPQLGRRSMSTLSSLDLPHPGLPVMKTDSRRSSTARKTCHCESERPSCRFIAALLTRCVCRLVLARRASWRSSRCASTRSSSSSPRSAQKHAPDRGGGADARWPRRGARVSRRGSSGGGALGPALAPAPL